MLPLVAGAVLVAAALRQEDQQSGRRRALKSVGMMSEDASPDDRLEVFQLLGIPGPWRDGLPLLTLHSSDIEWADAKDYEANYPPEPVRQRRRDGWFSTNWGTIEIGGGSFGLPTVENPSGTYADQGELLTGGMIDPRSPDYWSSTAGIEVSDDEAALLTRLVQEASFRVGRDLLPACYYCSREMPQVRVSRDGRGTWEPFCIDCDAAAARLLGDVKRDVDRLGLDLKVGWRTDGEELEVEDVAESGDDLTDEDWARITKVIASHGGSEFDNDVIVSVYAFTHPGFRR